MKYTGLYIIIALIWMLAGCKPPALGAKEYIKYCEDDGNGLKQESHIGDYYFICQYQPADYILAKELLQNITSPGSAGNRKQELAGLTYFNFKIDTRNQSSPVLKNGIADESDYGRRLEYFINGEKHFFLVQNETDTQYCKMYHFEQNYGLAPYNTIILGFEDKGIKSNPVLVYDDQELNTGVMKFAFNSKQLLNIPELTLKQP